MPEFLERDTGKTVTLEGPDAQAAFTSGKYGLAKGTDVPLMPPGGEVPGLVASHDVADAIAQGYRFAHPDEVKHAKAVAKFGGTSGAIQAGVAGAARGLSLGLSDVVARHVGIPAATLEGLQEANPATSIASEVTGAVAPAILSGGASAPESLAAGGAEGAELAASAARGATRALTAPTDAVFAAGRAAERAVTSALGNGTAARVVAKTAGTAVEGGLYGVGSQESEDAIGDHTTNAEKLFAAGLHGGLLGGAIGGALSTTGQIGTALLGRSARALEGAADEQYFRALSANKKSLVTEAKEKFGSTEPVANYLRQRGIVQGGDDLEASAAKAAKADTENLATLESKVAEVGVTGVRLGDVLDALESRKTEFEKKLGYTGAVTALQKQIDDLARIYEPEMARAERGAEGVFDLGLAKSEEAAPRATKAIGITGRDEPFAIDPDAGLGDNGEAGWRLDAEGRPVLHPGETESPITIDRTRPGHIGDGPTIDPTMTEGADVGPGGVGIRKAYDVGLKPGALTEEAGAVRKPIRITKDEAASAKQAAEARRDTTVPFRELLEQRRQLEGTINWGPGHDKPTNLGTKAAGRAIEEAIVGAGDRAAEASGRGAGEWRASYKAAKREFSIGRWVKDTTEDALDAKLRNRKLSPSDMAAGLAGMAGGLTHGVVGGLSGLALGAAHHVIRERGNAMAAVVLDRVAAFAGLRRATGTVDREVDRGIAGLLHPGARVPSVRRTNPYRDHVDRAEAVARAIVNLDEHAQRLEQATSAIAPHAPKTAAAFQSTGLRATQWLAQEIPASMKTHPRTLTPQLEEAYVSPTDAAAFVQKFDAVHDPASVLGDMRSGQVTPAQVQALRAVYPKLYAEITTKIGDELRTAKKPPSYEAKKQIALLFGIPADPTFDPAFVAAMQAAPANGSQSNASKPRGAPKRQITGIAAAASLPGQMSNSK